MSYWSYESKIVIDFKQSILPKERTLKWYLYKINDYFEVDLDGWFYNMNGFMNEWVEFEMIMNIVKSYIIYRLGIGSLYCETKGHKIYIKQLNMNGVKNND